MRRSGGHAVSSWLVQSVRDCVLFDDIRTLPPGAKSKTHFYRNGEKCEPYQVPTQIWTFEDVFIPNCLRVVRSVYNMMASRLQIAVKSENYGRYMEATPDFLALWKMFANNGHVLYDKFIEDRSYRQALADRLAIPNDDKGLEKFTKYPGLGSSFDEHHGMNERWKRVRLPDWLLQDDEAREINLDLFGWTLNRKGELCK